MDQVLPDKYREMSEPELLKRLQAIRAELGPDLIILAHHYQRQEIIDLGDFQGDSFLLGKRAAESQARFIVFCGVHFMAESAAVLAREDQAVFIPARNAGCPMADMAGLADVERAWRELAELADVARITPIAYVNSSAAVKAFCGRHGGATCTSSNADKLFSWAMKRGDKIFFVPDEHLGRNTAAKLGLEPVELWDPAERAGGLDPGRLRTARVIVWKGFCHVHTAFAVEQIREQRAEHPGCAVVVHPECRREVVEAGDASGSTADIIKYVEARPLESVTVVGTEIHLVERLARQQRGQRTVVPLARSLCPNMYRVNLHNLCWTLEAITAGPEHRINQVTVPAAVKADAALALNRMLDHAK